MALLDAGVAESGHEGADSFVPSAGLPDQPPHDRRCQSYRVCAEDGESGVPLSIMTRECSLLHMYRIRVRGKNNSISGALSSRGRARRKFCRGNAGSVNLACSSRYLGDRLAGK